jgi:predicted nuclease of predicted toxin-antitoxin system
MRLLLDESIPSRLRRSLTAHEVRTVGEMGWSGTKNGKLLALACADFDAFVTVDKNLPHQQNLANLPVAVVLLDAHSVELKALLPLVPALEQALLSLAPRTFVRVAAGT